MKKESQQILKNEKRKHFLILRGLISKERKEKAAAKLMEMLATKGRILTFYSIGSEIDLFPLNSLLASQKRVMANRLEDGMLVPYHVESVNDLLISDLGILEPDPKKSRKAILADIDLILVPALAFDKDGYRLGYGKGHYDRFLQITKDIPTAGVGFTEQLTLEPLPRDPWDLPVKELILV